VHGGTEDVNHLPHTLFRIGFQKRKQTLLVHRHPPFREAFIASQHYTQNASGIPHRFRNAVFPFFRLIR
jgi:hypothetical protein